MITISLSTLGASYALLTENFNAGSLPAGWTVAGTTTANWQISYTANAGGTSPELYFNYTPSGTGERRFISPTVITSGTYELELSFRHALNDYSSTSNNYTIGVQTSTNGGTTWTNLWTVTGTTSIAAEVKTFTINPLEMTPNFKFCFYFSGNPFDLNYWTIDNVSLTVTKTRGYGTWTSAGNPYNLNADVVVPAGQTLNIEHGVRVVSQGTYKFIVNGNLNVNGTAADSVVFTAANTTHPNGWRGFDFSTSAATDTIRFNYCRLEYSYHYGIGSSPVAGGMINLMPSAPAPAVNFRFSYSNFQNNFADTGAVVYAGYNSQGLLTFQNCQMQNNSGVTNSVITADGYTRLALQNCLIVKNVVTSSIGTHIAYTAAETYFSMFGCTVAYNTGGMVFTYIVSGGLQSFVINSTIQWNPDLHTTLSDPAPEIAINLAYGVINNPIIVKYSDIRNGAASIYACGNAVTFNQTGVITANPTLLAPNSGDFRLACTSPCLDMGDPAYTDADGSRWDIGAIPLNKLPVVKQVVDVPYDQGRAVEVFWGKSELDGIFWLNSFYSVWRQDTTPRGDATWIGSPQELIGMKPSDNIYWQDRHTAWHYMGQVPAYNLSDYCLIVPTLRDSSSTGTHAVPFMVIYQNNNGFYVSNPMSGYSVDNIAPDPVRNLTLTGMGSIGRLNWTEVTSGTFDGSSLPELNGVSYKIYAGDTPDFVIGPESFIMTTTDTSQVLGTLIQDKRFYRIVTTDNH